MRRPSRCLNKNKNFCRPFKLDILKYDTWDSPTCQYIANLGIRWLTHTNWKLILFHNPQVYFGHPINEQEKYLNVSHILLAPTHKIEDNFGFRKLSITVVIKLSLSVWSDDRMWPSTGPSPRKMTFYHWTKVKLPTIKAWLSAHNRTAPAVILDNPPIRILWFSVNIPPTKS